MTQKSPGISAEKGHLVASTDHELALFSKHHPNLSTTSDLRYFFVKRQLHRKIKFFGAIIRNITVIISLHGFDISLQDIPAYPW